MTLDISFVFLRCHHLDQGPVTFSGLPFDSAMMEKVFADIRHERIKGKQDWLELTDNDRKALFQSITDETWETMYEKVVSKTQPERTEKEFNQLRELYFSVSFP